MRIVVLGPPGSGRSVSAKKLAEKLKVPCLSSGAMLRRAAISGNAAGLAAKAILDEGEWVGDDVVNDLLANRLARPDTNRGFVLDGYPRTIRQAKFLDDLMASKRLHLDVALELTVDDEGKLDQNEARLSGDPHGGRTGLIQKRKKFVARIERYHQHTGPLLNFYWNLGLLISVDALQGIGGFALDIFAAREAMVRLGASGPLLARKTSNDMVRRRSWS